MEIDTAAAVPMPPHRWSSWPSTFAPHARQFVPCARHRECSPTSCRHARRPVPHQSGEWVALSPRFTPGWPWPEDSYGLGPIYGDDGWCRRCGTPLVEQRGSLVMQGSKFPRADVWTPNWLFDVVCVSAAVAADIQTRFVVDLAEVHKASTGPTGAQQLRPTQTAERWHRPEDLSAAVRARHAPHYGDRVGALCGGCGRWKWLPVNETDVPVLGDALESSSDVIASPEVFGAGLVAFRHVLFRRQLGETLAGASPRDWDVMNVMID